MRGASAGGLSVLEVLFALSLTLAAAGAAVPAMLEIDRALRLRSSSAFIAGYLQRARLDAITRSAAIGVRFRAAGADWLIGSYADGNGNGIRNAEIASGLDAVIDPELAFSARCPSVRVARLREVPDVNGASGSDAVRLGSSDIATFDPDGTSTSGTVYLTDGRTQIAVTLTAATGRVRVRRWDPRMGVWQRMR
ncbi:MAG: GspH/FimT family pseudopilin [Acidobacteriota bacterium]|nr:GspH/FimT family pseudopilin [Acidobacteriota bacterium]